MLTCPVFARSAQNIFFVAKMFNNFIEIFCNQNQSFWRSLCIGSTGSWPVVPVCIGGSDGTLVVPVTHFSVLGSVQIIAVGSIPDAPGIATASPTASFSSWL